MTHYEINSKGIEITNEKYYENQDKYDYDPGTEHDLGEYNKVEELKIGSYNTEGFANHRTIIEQILEEHNLDILALQETYLNSQDCEIVN